MTNKLITVGCDPEFFVTRDGKIVASQDIIPGTKHEPHWLTGGAIHRDNILGELAMSPASTEDMFVSNLYSVIDQAKQILLEHDADMLWQPSAFVDDSCLQHYEAMEFGCDPDWDCWNYTKPSTPNPLDAGNLRSSGGHAHVGFEYEDREDQFRAAGSLDVYLGLPSVLFDSDKLRRNLYGKSGRFRPKPYGIEYRTLSNQWLNSESLIRWVYRQAVLGVNERHNNPISSSKDVAELQRIINTSDSDAAQSWVTDLNIEVPAYG